MQAAGFAPRCKLLALALPPFQHTLPAPMAISTRIHIQQYRSSSFLHDNTDPSARPPQKAARESWFTRKRRQRNARSKISTLALDHSIFSLETETQGLEDARSKDQNHNKQDKKQNTTKQRGTSRSRRLLIWAAVLTMPMWGRDIVEVVVPGTLGVFILVAGSIKRGIQRTWAFLGTTKS